MPSDQAALADEIEAAMKGMSLLKGDDLERAVHALGKLAYAHSSQIVAALRSGDCEDGARKMRERAAAACDKRRERTSDDDSYDSGFRMGCAACADDIAALPLTTRTGDGDA